MIKYKLTISYDGTDFSGWQVQPNCSSVSQTLQDSFARKFNQKISVLGASRTDSGVHALGQVAGFQADFAIDIDKMRYAWNNVLPNTVVIRSLERAHEKFHPFYNVENKTYYYHFFLSRPLPFLQRYGLHYWYQINLEHLNKALQLFVGTHNFRSFSSGEPISDNPVCTISSITVEYIRRFGAYRIVVTGNRFLCHMVRRMVGAALSVATIKNNAALGYIENLLKIPNPNNSLPNAPAKGLLLYKIRYK